MSHLRAKIVTAPLSIPLLPSPNNPLPNHLQISCSLTCYKSHKTYHSEDDATIIQQQQAAKRDRPGTTRRVPKPDFTGFEDNAEFQRMLTRYPFLKAQLQVAYALTLEPGPEEQRSWNRQPLLGPLQS